MKRVSAFCFVLCLAVGVFAQGDVPAHHASAPRKSDKLPAILAREQLLGPSFTHPTQKHAYELAAKISDVIYQQPCACRCDRSAGHTSLRSCFESDHAAHCAACMQELYYSYLETKKGKAPAEIRKNIMQGQWEKINLDSAYTIN